MSLPRIGDSKVLESRETDDGTTIRRRRVSSDGHRFTTYERIELPQLIVVKRSGNREVFDRDKLLMSVKRSVGKFIGSDLEVEDVVSRVEERLRQIATGDKVSSEQVGNAVLDVLAGENEVAYVRFASVFLKFKTLGDFERILRERREDEGGLRVARSE